MFVEEPAEVSHVDCPDPDDLPQVESAHVMIALQTTVHDGSISLLSYAFSCHVFVDPVRVSPHAGVDLAKLDRCTRDVCDGLFEGGVEVSVVEENIWIMEPAVEMPLH